MQNNSKQNKKHYNASVIVLMDLAYRKSTFLYGSVIQTSHRGKLLLYDMFLKFPKIVNYCWEANVIDSQIVSLLNADLFWCKNQSQNRSQIEMEAATPALALWNDTVAPLIAPGKLNINWCKKLAHREAHN